MEVVGALVGASVRALVGDVVGAGDLVIAFLGVGDFVGSFVEAFLGAAARPLVAAVLVVAPEVRPRVCPAAFVLAVSAFDPQAAAESVSASAATVSTVAARTRAPLMLPRVWAIEIPLLATVGIAE
ncbi:MAG: hypothetical protein ACR2F6_03310 [Mycobacteriales bacterium]